MGAGRFFDMLGDGELPEVKVTVTKDTLINLGLTAFFVTAAVLVLSYVLKTFLGK